MLRIMTTKAATAASDSCPAPAAKVNGTTASADTLSERGSDKRGPKPGKKNAGRGRNNPKKGKDGGDGGDGEGSSKTDAKSHPRRKGGNSGKKEPGNKGERVRSTCLGQSFGTGELMIIRDSQKKKVFAPKDATAQGTPAKS
ncbi:hypothetical protein AM587_10000483 [Phytophthora nicotianae]|uniref:Uncharacterized protein n=1 Tax=Phytophthora nicotianae TaxID=4792 RepID=A0A0W8DC89_PHYNI|nr:hypothetical protein AM587_10000483 [Phytophthora nicotianae]